MGGDFHSDDTVGGVVQRGSGLNTRILVALSAAAIGVVAVGVLGLCNLLAGYNVEYVVAVGVDANVLVVTLLVAVLGRVGGGMIREENQVSLLGNVEILAVVGGLVLIRGVLKELGQGGALVDVVLRLALEADVLAPPSDDGVVVGLQFLGNGPGRGIRMSFGGGGFCRVKGFHFVVFGGFRSAGSKQHSQAEQRGQYHD